MSKKIFISYKREDEAFARRLREFLIEDGFETWMDVFDIPKGVHPEKNTETWDEAIDKGLAESDIVVGVITPESVASRNVINEWRWAITYQKPLQLVNLRKSVIPHRFVGVNYIDCSSNENLGFDQLAKALQRPKVYKETLDERNRRIMLAKVHDYWVKGVLEKSLHGVALLELGMEEQPGAVEHPWEMVIPTEKEDKLIPPETKIIDIFENMQQAMLILGEPGSGKTITMLELARDAIKLAQVDETRPIPVVLNLSTWSVEQASLEDWILAELNSKYQIPKKLAQRWVGADALMLLLDGFDEVNPDTRSACGEAINNFRDGNEHGLVPIVVCSRTQEYQTLQQQLKLDGAVKIQPMSKIQIIGYFENTGDKLVALKRLMQEHEELFEIAESPLMLNIMSLAYQEATSDELLKIQGQNKEIQKEHVFDKYIQRMFNRFARTKSNIFEQADTLKWLSWLARQMKAHNQTIFYLESLQPTWLSIAGQRRALRNLFRLVFGLYFAVAFGLFFDMYISVDIGIVIGLVIGLVVGQGEKLSPRSVLGFSWKSMGRSVLGFSWKSMGRKFVKNWKSMGRKFVKNLNIGVAIGVVIVVVGGLVGGMANGGLFNALIVLVTIGVVIGLPIGLVIGLVGELVGEEQLERRTMPKQGVRQTFFAGLLGYIFSILVSELFFGTPWLDLGLYDGLIIGTFFGLFIGFYYGWHAYIGHYIIRFLLWRYGKTPRDFVTFLDYATSIIFLRKVGGGYVFIHRMLLEHLAELDVDAFIAEHG